MDNFFLYFELKEVDIWPSKELFMEYMPADCLCNFQQQELYLMKQKFPSKIHLMLSASLLHVQIINIKTL